MKKLYTFIALTVATVPTYAHAQTLAMASNVETSCQGDSTNPPEAPAGFSFDETEQAFRNSRKPNSTDLTGSFKLIGVAAISPMFLSDLPSQYSPSGIKNLDGSETATLTFASRTGYFDGGDQTVKIQGLGGDESQGPYTLNYDNNTDAAYFTTYSYTGKKMNSRDHYNWECRIATDDSAKMLCAIRMVFTPESIKNLDPGQGQFNNQIGAYFGYARK